MVCGCPRSVLPDTRQFEKGKNAFSCYSGSKVRQVVCACPLNKGCAGELAELLELSEGQVVDKMLKHALPPLVEAGNKAALEALAQKAGTDLASLLQDNGATIIAKCLYEGASPHLTLPCPVTKLCVRRRLLCRAARAGRIAQADWEQMQMSTMRGRAFVM